MTVEESKRLNERLNVLKYKIKAKNIKASLFDIEYIMEKVKANTI